jgi:site-specific DNA recombinase
MYASHAVKNGKRYRYYVTHPKHVPSGGPRPWRMAAHPLERLVAKELAQYLASRSRISEAIPHATAEDIETAFERCADDAKRLATSATCETREIFVRRIVSLTVKDGSLKERLELAEGAFIDRTIAYAEIRSGVDVRLQIVPDDQETSSARDEPLVALIVEAHAARHAMLAAPSKSIEDIAHSQGIGFARFKQLVRLSYLAPDIVESIFTGSQPPQLTLAYLKLAKAIPLFWTAQRSMFEIN